MRNIFHINGDKMYIQATHLGVPKIIVVDADMINVIAQYPNSWLPSQVNGKVIMKHIRHVNGRVEYTILDRLIMGVSKRNMTVVHLDGDYYNCLRSNMRVEKIDYWKRDVKK